MSQRSGPSCRCCGGPARWAFTTYDVNQRLSAEPFDYERCERCGTYQLANVPDDVGSYYPASYYDQLDVGLQQQDAELARGQLDVFSRFVSGGRVIDIGP